MKFLESFLWILHGELNRHFFCKSLKIEALEAQEYWRQFTLSEDSLIKDIFFGL